MNIFSGFLEYLRLATLSLIRPSPTPTATTPTEKQTQSSSIPTSKMASQLNVAPESFPTVEPAFTIQVQISGKYMVGDVFTGSTLAAVPFTAGVIKSVPSFEKQFELEVFTGQDFFYIDADKSHARFNVNAIAKDSNDVAVSVKLAGLTKLTENIQGLLFGAPDASTSPFGYGIETVSFETGHPEYKFLEQNIWAASQRFAIVDGAFVVQLRVSKVSPGTGME